MSVNLNVDGQSFPFPQRFDKNWAPAVTGWAVAVTAGMIQTNGVNPMTGNLTFTNNGSIILKDSEGTPKSVTLSVPSPISSSYVLTLPTTAGSNGQVLGTNGAGVTSWINAAGTGTVNSGTTGQLAYFASNGTAVSGETVSGDATLAAGGALTISSSAIIDSKVSATAAITRTKLAAGTAYRILANNSSGVISENAAITPSSAVASDANGQLVASSTNATELGYVHGVTSAIQTQFGTVLALAGGTMSGAINMGSHKISSLTQGSASGEAVTFDQINPVKLNWANSGFVGSTVTSASNVFVNSGLSITITPKSASSQILILGQMAVGISGATALTTAGIRFTPSAGFLGTNLFTALASSSTSETDVVVPVVWNAGTTGTTSPITISVAFNRASGNGTVSFCPAPGGQTMWSYLVAIEIG